MFFTVNRGGLRRIQHAGGSIQPIWARQSQNASNTFWLNRAYRTSIEVGFVVNVYGVPKRDSSVVGIFGENRLFLTRPAVVVWISICPLFSHTFDFQLSEVTRIHADSCLQCLRRMIFMSHDFRQLPQVAMFRQMLQPQAPALSTTRGCKVSPR